MTLAQHEAIVLGAGVAGLSTAALFAAPRRRRHSDRSAATGGGASFGNAGLLSPDTAVPIALPGMLRKVPGWLVDPLVRCRCGRATSRVRCRG